MKTLAKTPFITFFIGIFLLAGCQASNISHLNEDETKLHEINQDTADQIRQLSEALEEPTNENPNYTAMWEKAGEAESVLAKSARELEPLNLPEETAQVKENTAVILESTSRIVDKVRELTADGKYLASEEASEEISADLNQILASLHGYKERLAKSAEKFENLNTQLTEDAK